jgi:hypothetical protein
VDLGGGSLAVKEFQAIDKIDFITPRTALALLKFANGIRKRKSGFSTGHRTRFIPVRMGRELAQNFPFVDFFPAEGANHVSVLSEARDKIIRWMNN